MRMALSTSWNARRQPDGSALVDEALALGFDALELGYHTTEEQAAGVRRRVAAGALTVDSVHAYCPVPTGAPHGYPELYLLTSADEDEQAMARLYLLRTLAFAASMGARAVVLHAGRIRLGSRLWGDPGTAALVERLDSDGVASPAYQRLLARARRRRQARQAPYRERFCRSLEQVLPKFEQAGVVLCLENLPSIEAFPDADEMVALRGQFASSALGYWHDMGHGQVRAFLGWESHEETAARLLACTRGMHIHDALPPVVDHLPPGEGAIDFGAFAFYGAEPLLRVFEPAPDVPAEALRAALAHVRRAWAVTGS